MEKIGGSAKIRRIAITGIPSSGKSTVCEILRDFGAYVVKADDIVHILLSSDSEIIRNVTELLGTDIVVDGRINRTRVASIVFQDGKKLKALESILHPRVMKEIKRVYETVKTVPQYKAFVVEVPLLFEGNFQEWVDEWFDTTVTIVADEETCKSRFMQSGFTPEQFDLRMANHLSQKQKSQRSHITIENNQTIDILKSQVRSII